LQAKAGPYRVLQVEVFARDSARILFEDSTLTGDAMRAGTWMFGPPVTTAEADGCPPEKVLGRQLARILWRGIGKPTTIERISVTVRGTIGKDRWSSMAMFYPLFQLNGPWAGDPVPR